MSIRASCLRGADRVLAGLFKGILSSYIVTKKIVVVVALRMMLVIFAAKRKCMVLKEVETGSSRGEPGDKRGKISPVLRN
jgi:hypothetical protein